MIASDDEVVKCLVWALGSRSRRVAEAVCNAIMDLSTSPIGRERLRNSFAIERLLCSFCQMAATPLYIDILDIVEKESGDSSNIESMRDSILVLILDAAVVLINTCGEEFLDQIPKELVRQFLPFLRPLWDKIQCLELPSNYSQQKSFLRITKYDLAATIFRLSMNQADHATWGYDEVRISIFGGKESDFENFILNYWENSLLILSRASKNLEKDNNIFSSLIHSFIHKMTDDALDSILLGLVSCPPIASDELDINCFLNEVNVSLGSPIMYGQDIRILKTQEVTTRSLNKDVKKELHLFKIDAGPIFMDADNVQKSKEAFRDGYTIALRGMEFRSDKVAAIAEGLADLFGQPSVGANLYVTPPGSQGLAKHYDDHCVFVCQLFGCKQWTISPRPTSILPRLYDPIGSLHGSESSMSGSMQILLKEGDILYVPRGYPHEAHTVIDEYESRSKASNDFSLHLTLAVEVEPPFEWEGFAHVALHGWNEKQKQASSQHCDSKLENLRTMLALLLHVAIRLISDHDPIFRKACMVAAKHWSADTDEDHHVQMLSLSQRATFGYIIDKIHASSNYIEAFRIIETVVQERNDDSLQWMRWLQHLPQHGDVDERLDFNNLLGVLDDLIVLYNEDNKKAMIEFTQFKSQFCRYVIFEDACKSFVILLEKYRKIRKQYTKGMLSLHSKYSQ
ncbi:Bifunctional lysine-specific demethylase and histidyl-hydroxylase NO66 [Cocos nucifera]|nr:Bifunctional lysine-specific demethylase and histidyl-hydroxylase NO66 [Cocos nucifera]